MLARSPSPSLSSCMCLPSYLCLYRSDQSILPASDSDNHLDFTSKETTSLKRAMCWQPKDQFRVPDAASLISTVTTVIWTTNLLLRKSPTFFAPYLPIWRYQFLRTVSERLVMRAGETYKACVGIENLRPSALCSVNLPAEDGRPRD